MLYDAPWVHFNLPLEKSQQSTFLHALFCDIIQLTFELEIPRARDNALGHCDPNVFRMHSSFIIFHTCTSVCIHYVKKMLHVYVCYIEAISQSDLSGFFLSHRSTQEISNLSKPDSPTERSQALFFC